MSNSELKQLGELAVLRTEKAAKSKDADVSYVGLEHIAQGQPILLGTIPSTSSTSTNNVFYYGDILFGKLRPNLRKSLQADFNGYCSTDILVLTPIDALNPRFVARVFQQESVFRFAVRHSVGTKMPRVNWAELQNCEVFVPKSLGTQRAIADILDTMDEAIRVADETIAKMKNIKAGLLHDLLTYGINEHGDIRDPERHPEQFKDSPLGLIPKGWEVLPLEAKKRSDRPFIKTGPFGSSLKGEHWVDDGVPVITIGALGEGEFKAEELLFVTEKTAHELIAYLVEKGDLVFSRVADVGRSVVVTEKQSGWLMSSNLMRISLKQDEVIPYYAYLNMTANPLTRKQIRQLVNSGGRDVASTPILRSLLFTWSPIQEQKRIVDIATYYEIEISRYQSEREKLDLVKLGLMNDLLTGNVRVTDVDIVRAVEEG